MAVEIWIHRNGKSSMRIDVQTGDVVIHKRGGVTVRQGFADYAAAAKSAGGLGYIRAQGRGAVADHHRAEKGVDK